MSQDTIQAGEIHVIHPPKQAGYFDWGCGVQVYVLKRPNAWQRWWYRVTFGWKWVDT